MAISLLQGPPGSKLTTPKPGEAARLYQNWYYATLYLANPVRRLIKAKDPLTWSKLAMAMAVIKQDKPQQPALYAFYKDAYKASRIVLTPGEIESLASDRPAIRARQQQKGETRVAVWAANVVSVITGTPMPGATPELMAALDNWHAEYEAQWAAWAASEEGAQVLTRVREGKDEADALDVVYDFETGEAVTSRPQGLDAVRDRAAAAATRLVGIKATAEAQAKLAKAFNAELAKAAAAQAENDE